MSQILIQALNVKRALHKYEFLKPLIKPSTSQFPYVSATTHMRQVHAHKMVESDVISLLGKQYFLFLYNNTSGAKKESWKTEHKSSQLPETGEGGS